MRSIHKIPGAALLLAALACPALPSSVPMDWKPVDPADLALKTPRVDKDAGAEALFWETWVTDELHGSEPTSVFTHYVRLKIFNEHGRDAHGTIDLPYTGKESISDIAGRTIKPDGSIVELKKDSVFDRMIVQVGGGLIAALDNLTETITHARVARGAIHVEALLAALKNFKRQWNLSRQLIALFAVAVGSLNHAGVEVAVVV